MKPTDSKGRPVCDLEWDYNNDGSAYLVKAYYDDVSPGVLEEVPEEELDWIMSDRGDLVEEAELECRIMAAEAWAERDR